MRYGGMGWFEPNHYHKKSTKRKYIIYSIILEGVQSVVSKSVLVKIIGLSEINS